MAKQFYFTGDKSTQDASAEVDSAYSELDAHIQQAQLRYGDFSSTHEALGVVIEELDELKDAIRANALEAIREEAIDAAAVLVRLAVQCRTSAKMKERSVK
jgi:NTP pyrophosphatase (non-canonical NTP hydrolase)